MQSFGNPVQNYSTFPSLTPGFGGWLGQHDALSSPFISAQPWRSYPGTYVPLTNPAAFSSSFPLFSTCPPCNDFAPPGPNWSGRDPDPFTLWSRGASSPCFRHDHHIITRYSAPPISAGNWEIDRRHMIEVQFDQFGVASHCRSTWGRMGPWRADCYRYSVEKAYSKLRIEIMMFMSRLGFDLNEHPHQGAQDLRHQFPPWMNQNGYGYPYDDLSTQLGFSPSPWNILPHPFQNHF